MPGRAQNEKTVIYLFFIAPAAVFCIDDEYSRATLKGLENFGVIVHLVGQRDIDFIAGTVEEYLDVFISAYYSVNRPE